ncbi:MAG: hypothetical protein ACRDPO_14875 [Streptosporangiaceae bacterium]
MADAGAAGAGRDDPAGRAAAVSCSSSSACLAIAIDAYPHSGDLGTFAETWNGALWRARAVPNGQNNASLNGVNCRSAHWCMAVGTIEAVPPTGHYVPVADRWNGSTWAQARPPAGATAGSLAAVACPGTRSCTAVGSSSKGHNAPRPLADHWNGSAWKTQRVPAPAGGGSQLAAVACPRAYACRAVGSDSKGLFSEVWNGSSWVVRPVPVPAGGSFAGLNGISCPAADRCEAVGTYEKGSTFLPLAEAWNGSRWHLQAPPGVPGEPSAGLDAVSCISATDCEAAGSAGVQEGPQEVGVLEKWNGAAWSVQKKVRPAGDLAARLNGISCTTGPVCETVGWHEKSVPNSHLLALRYSS